VDIVAAQAFIHDYTPHNSVALYGAAALSSLVAIGIVWFRCLWTKSGEHLREQWILTTATVAAPIPTYLLLILMPLDHDLSQTILDDPIVVALAGLYGVVEAVKEVRRTASQAHKRKNGTA
jgi:hypothetical protein